MADLAALRAEMEAVEARIARMVSGTPVDPVGDAFHLGRVGGSGDRRTMARLNRHRERALERTIDVARALAPLYREHGDLRRRIADIESGRVERRERAKAASTERVRTARVGDRVLDSAYGVATVVRVNRKTLTIETASGYREARPYSLILDVIHTPSTEG